MVDGKDIYDSNLAFAGWLVFIILPPPNLLFISAVDGTSFPGMYFWNAELDEGLKLAAAVDEDALEEVIPKSSSCICFAADWYGSYSWL